MLKAEVCWDTLALQSYTILAFSFWVNFLFNRWLDLFFPKFSDGVVLNIDSPLFAILVRLDLFLLSRSSLWSSQVLLSTRTPDRLEWAVLEETNLSFGDRRLKGFLLGTGDLVSLGEDGGVFGSIGCNFVIFECSWGPGRRQASWSTRSVVGQSTLLGRVWNHWVPSEKSEGLRSSQGRLV